MKSHTKDPQTSLSSGALCLVHVNWYEREKT